jgi:hypothetical protein
MVGGRRNLRLNLNQFLPEEEVSNLPEA